MSPQPESPVVVYPALVRVLAAALFVLSRGSIGLLLVRVLVARDPPITPPILFRLFLVFVVIPTAALWLLRRMNAGDVDVERKLVVLRKRHALTEVPAGAIKGVTPWSVPFPGPGFSLRLRSGRRLRNVVEAADPLPILRALADRAGLLAAEFAMKHPIVVWAHAREEHGRPRWLHYLGKYVLFGLLPAAVLFNAHQHIAYGGLLGQYYQEGLGPYLATLLVYWATTSIYLLLYGGVLRFGAELVALGAAVFVPERARRARRAAEIGYRVMFFGGVPALLALRFSD